MNDKKLSRELKEEGVEVTKPKKPKSGDPQPLDAGGGPPPPPPSPPGPPAPPGPGGG